MSTLTNTGASDILNKWMEVMGHNPQEAFPKEGATALVVASDPVEMGDEALTTIAFYDEDRTINDAVRFMNALATLFINLDIQENETMTIRQLQVRIIELIAEVDKLVQGHINKVVHSQSFKRLEANWLSLEQLYKSVGAARDDDNDNEVIIDFLEATKEDIRKDLDEHVSDILTSALFKKVYVDEYDRYGGRPFGTMIGLYEFDSTEDDVDWLRIMGRICSASQLPFIASAGAKFFDLDSYDELALKGDLGVYMDQPKFGDWNELRLEDNAAYIGLTLPRYLLRSPWETDGDRLQIAFNEKISTKEDYLWGNPAILMARNMVRSFENSAWCQHIRGPKGGGEIKGLPVHIFERHGREEVQPPVEFEVPDYMELEFAKNGFIALVNKKLTADCTYFSARAIKKALVFVDEIDTQNADLVCNLAYTLSITRIAHYVQRMVRDYIGSTADGNYIRDMLTLWLSDYVTTVTNPDDLTLLYYPFKAVDVQVEPKPGPLGWYKGIISVLPHIQFEGMDVELRLEAALGGK